MGLRGEGDRRRSSGELHSSAVDEWGGGVGGRVQEALTAVPKSPVLVHLVSDVLRFLRSLPRGCKKQSNNLELTTTFVLLKCKVALRIFWRACYNGELLNSLPPGVISLRLGCVFGGGEGVFLTKNLGRGVH